MSDSARARPRQLTTALWLVVVGSVFQVLSVFDRVSTLQSVDTRQEIRKVLDSGSGSGLGISVDEALAAVRVGLTVSALCAAAAVVLGIFALQRHRGARIGLSVLAVPILVTALLTGGLVGALIAVAVAFTWTQPARDWFAGRPVRESSRRPDQRHRPAPVSPPPPEPASAEDSAPPSLSTDDTSTAPRPVSGFGAAPVHAPVLERPAPLPASAPQVGQTSTGPTSTGRPPVPGSVRAACIVTWVFSATVAVLYVAMLVVLLVDRGWIVSRVTASPVWAEAGVDERMLVPMLWVGCLMFLGWSLSAMALAFLAWRRHDWARYLLVCSAGAAVVAAFFAFPVGLVHQIAAGYVIYALFTPAARRWFALPSRSWGPPPGGNLPPTGSSPGSSAGSSGGSSSDKPPVW